VDGRRRLDVSGPLDIPWRLAQAWPDAELVVIDEAGHGTAHTSMTEALLAALNPG
jgi:proline iminopeptidase